MGKVQENKIKFIFKKKKTKRDAAYNECLRALKFDKLNTRRTLQVMSVLKCLYHQKHSNPKFKRYPQISTQRVSFVDTRN